MGIYEIEITTMPYGLDLTAVIGGTTYKSRYKHRDIIKALQEFRALVLKYEPKNNTKGKK